MFKNKLKKSGNLPSGAFKKAAKNCTTYLKDGIDDTSNRVDALRKKNVNKIKDQRSTKK